MSSWNNRIGSMSMRNFAPREISTLYHLDIAQNKWGYWVAKDDRGLIGGVFRSRKDALHFALFEAAGDSARVRVLPADGAPVDAPSGGGTSKKDRH
jgi:hypothetical protein